MICSNVQRLRDYLLCFVLANFLLAQDSRHLVAGSRQPPLLFWIAHIKMPQSQPKPVGIGLHPIGDFEILMKAARTHAGPALGIDRITHVGPA